MKIINLIYNEVLKQTKKLSFKISMLILVLFAIGVPFLYKTVIFNDNMFPLYFESDIQYYENDLIASPKNSEEELNNELVNIRIDVVKQAIDNDEKSSNFKLEVYEDYITNKRLVKVTEYLLEGKDFDYKKLDDSFELNGSYLLELKEDELKEEQKNLNNKINDLEKVIKNNDYSWYLDSQIKSLKENENLTSLDKKTIEVYEKLKEANVTDEDDFRVDEANSIIENYTLKEEAIPKAEYDKMDSKIVYSDYVKMIDLKNKALDDEITKSSKAIEDNIDYNNNAKEAFADSVNTNNTILSIIIVVIAGGIVANEFQKGTIRLLVIRPNKRWKVLLSKFLAVVFMAIALSLITYVLSFIANGIMFGFNNLFSPDLKVIGNKITEASYLLTSLKDMFILLIPVIFIGLIAFSLSTIINNTAFSVGLSIFILMGYSMAIMVLQMLECPFIDLTFLPYLSYNQFLSPLALINSCEFNNMYYTFAKANIVLLVWSMVIYLLSNIVFVRKDIKN